jgi:hypothetical protein
MDEIEFIEKYFDIKLSECEKYIVQNLKDKNLYVLPARHAGRSNCIKILEAMLEWEELNKSKN